MSSPGDIALSSRIEGSPQLGQQPQHGQEANQISEVPILVDASVTGASQDTPTIDASHIGIHDWTDGTSEFDLQVDDPGDSFESPLPLRCFRGRWLSRDRNALEDASEVGAIDEAAVGTPNFDWEMDSIPANPESPPGVVVAERDAKVLANHTFLSNVKWSSISMPWETGFLKNIFGEDVLGLASDLGEDASWLEAVTHVPVSTIATDSSNPS